VHVPAGIYILNRQMAAINVRVTLSQFKTHNHCMVGWLDVEWFALKRAVRRYFVKLVNVVFLFVSLVNKRLSLLP